MRVVAYGVPADYADEYLCIGEDSTIEYVHRFAKVIICVLEYFTVNRTTLLSRSLMVDMTVWKDRILKFLQTKVESELTFKKGQNIKFRLI